MTAARDALLKSVITEKNWLSSKCAKKAYDMRTSANARDDLRDELQLGVLAAWFTHDGLKPSEITRLTTALDKGDVGTLNVMTDDILRRLLHGQRDVDYHESAVPEIHGNRFLPPHGDDYVHETRNPLYPERDIDADYDRDDSVEQGLLTVRPYVTLPEMAKRVGWTRVADPIKVCGRPRKFDTQVPLSSWRLLTYWKEGDGKQPKRSYRSWNLFGLAFFDCLPYPQVAAIMGEPASRTNNIKAQALERMRYVQAHIGSNLDPLDQPGPGSRRAISSASGQRAVAFAR